MLDLPANPGVRDAVYRLEDVLVDADLFRRLRLRGCARVADDGIANFEAALALVTGEPYDRRRRGGYGWVTAAALDHHHQAMVTDVAQTVATYQLQAGRPEQAIEACQVALLAGATDDTTRLNMYRAHKDLGDERGATFQVKQLLLMHEVDDEVDCRRTRSR